MSSIPSPELFFTPSLPTILYEDRHLLVVDKPPGLAVHPSPKHRNGTLVDLLRQRQYAQREQMADAGGGGAQWQGLGEEQGQQSHRIQGGSRGPGLGNGAYRHYMGAGGEVLSLVHRIDRETSGIVVCAKDAETTDLMAVMFRERDVSKDYYALVWGAPESDSGMIRTGMAFSQDSQVHIRMAVLPEGEGQPAATDWTVQKRFRGYTLLKCVLHSGRQHQIRAHLAHIGLPVVGDKIYGPDEELFIEYHEGRLRDNALDLLEMPRHALHAHRVSFRHPWRRGFVDITSPIPSDMEQFMAKLG